MANAKQRRKQRRMMRRADRDEIRAWTKAGTGKLKGRTCVVSDGHTPTRGFKGKGSTKRMHGCFTSAARAKERAAEIEGR